MQPAARGVLSILHSCVSQQDAGLWPERYNHICLQKFEGRAISALTTFLDMRFITPQGLVQPSGCGFSSPTFLGSSFLSAKLGVCPIDSTFRAPGARAGQHARGVQWLELAWAGAALQPITCCGSQHCCAAVEAAGSCMDGLGSCPPAFIDTALVAPPLEACACSVAASPQPHASNASAEVHSATALVTQPAPQAMAAPYLTAACARACAVGRACAGTLHAAGRRILCMALRAWERLQCAGAGPAWGRLLATLHA